MFEFKNKTILILSPEDWGANLLSKHLYAKELSKNNIVYFIHTSPHSSQNKFIESSSISKNLNLVHLRNVARGIFKLPSIFIDLQNKIIINQLLKEINRPIDVVWSFDQSKFQNLKQFKSKISIFHPVDYIIKAAPFTPRIADSADIVISVSQSILNIINTKTPKYFINHGLDEIFLLKKNQLEQPPFIKKETINVGYVGNLQMKLIDYKNLIKTVRENTAFNFIFIGPEKKSNLGNGKKNTELDTLKSCENTYFTGELSKEILANVLPFFDVFWLCYNHKKYAIEVSNSHKILEYCSTGKVIISNYITTYANKSYLLEMVEDNIDLSAKFKKVITNLNLYNSKEKSELRINFANKNTYTKHLLTIENIIKSL